MRSPALFASALALVALTVALRSAMRRSVTHWMVAHLSTQSHRARAQAGAWYGVSTLAALLALAAAALGVRAGGVWADARYVIVPLVMALYVPVVTLGSPRLTRWQKPFERRLLEAGAAREVASVVAGVARIFSGCGVLVAVLALALIADHAP